MFCQMRLTQNSALCYYVAYSVQKHVDPNSFDMNIKVSDLFS